MEPPPSIHLHIDRIIIDGLPFATSDAAPLRTALEADLTCILCENFQGMPPASLAVDMLPVAHFATSAASGRASFSRELAVTLGETLSGAFATPSSAAGL